jgi:hypothetical protein
MAFNKPSARRGWHFNYDTQNLEAYNRGNEIFQYPFGVNYYVTKAGEGGTGSGVDTNSGLSWAQSFLTIQAALDAVGALARRGGVKIFVGPGGYTEDLITPITGTAPFGELIAVNPTPGRSYGAVWLQASTAGEPALKIRAKGWHIRGFEFDALADATCVLLDGTVSTYSAPGTLIEDCLFVGADRGLYGIEVNNDLSNSALTTVRNCGFYGFNSGSTAAYCMFCSNSDNDAPRFWLVEDNWFGDSDNLVKMKFKESIVQRNTFFAGGANRNPADKLDNTSGGNSNFSLNTFGGAYTNAGGYTAGSGDDWSGNMAEDVSNRAKNGWTFAVPA